MITADVAVVGAGPAGLAAAAEAARHGLSVTLLDDNPLPGGQYYRQGPATREPDSAPAAGGKARDARARELLSVVDHPRVTFLSGAVVWAAPEARTLAFSHAGRGDRLRAEVIVIAAGASDRAVPFPGWTLPGVITAGGAQNLLKSQGVLPGRRALVAGSGPLLLVVADSLRRAGATVVGVAEAAPTARVWRALPRLAAAPALLRRGLAYRLELARARVAFRAGHTVIEARGRDEVEEAVVAPIDGAGRVDRAGARTLAVDTVVVGFGLVPSTELTRLLGCRHEWRRARGGGSHGARPTSRRACPACSSPETARGSAAWRRPSWKAGSPASSPRSGSAAAPAPRRMSPAGHCAVDCGASRAFARASRRCTARPPTTSRC